MRDAVRFLGLAGLVLLLFGLVSFATTPEFDLWTAVHLAGGGILLALAVAGNLAGVRRTVARKGTRQRLQAVVGAALFAAILVTVNVLAARHPKRWDATENRIHTLSPASAAVVRALRQPVEVLAVYAPADPGRRDVGDLLARFAQAGTKLSFRFLDPDREVELVRTLGVVRDKTLVARAGETTAQSEGDARGGVTEGTVANLLLKVTRTGPRKVYAVTGHGEPSLEDLEDARGLGALARVLADANFTPEPLLLSARPAVPDDALAVVLAGPRKPLLPHESEALGAYLSRGGRLLVLLDPGEDVGLGPLLADHGVTATDTMVVDQQQVPFFGARLGLDPIVERFPEHPITRDFGERVLLLQARTVEWGAPRKAGVEGQVIAETGDASWAEREWREALATGRVAQDPGDAQGPLPVAVAVTGPAGATGTSAGGRARLVVVGDADLARNANLDAYFNRELLLAIVQWLAGEEDLIAERPRSLRPSRLEMTDVQARNLFRFSVIFLPEALIVLGLGIWWRRRAL